ncbi:hypothetical protein MAP00_007085 [Monascus purpureus]|nr:hypothetical protein MAP00_007085 [Monascus purpureus]
MGEDSAPPAPAPASTADTTSGHDPAAPIKADVHHQNDIHDDQLPAQEKNQSRTKAAPRPDFLQKLINSGSFHSSIDEHHSIELDRYFVCAFYPILSLGQEDAGQQKD